MKKSLPIPKIHPHTPKQINSYDCGMYVLSMVEAIVKNYGGIDIKSGEVFEKISPDYVTKKRQEILQLIQHLISQKNN